MKNIMTAITFVAFSFGNSYATPEHMQNVTIQQSCSSSDYSSMEAFKDAVSLASAGIIMSSTYGVFMENWRKIQSPGLRGAFGGTMGSIFMSFGFFGFSRIQRLTGYRR